MDTDTLIKTLTEALRAASEHLDYCGYGDKWERECAEAQGLEKKIADALKAAEEAPAEKPEPTSRKVFVVMGNDFPDAAFSTEEAADAYVAQKKAEKRPDGGVSRIYWRVNSFELVGKLPRDKQAEG